MGVANMTQMGREVACQYLNEETGDWQRDGCRAETREDLYVCICNHLTKFSITPEVNDMRVSTDHGAGRMFSLPKRD